MDARRERPPSRRRKTLLWVLAVAIAGMGGVFAFLSYLNRAPFRFLDGQALQDELVLHEVHAIRYEFEGSFSSFLTKAEAELKSLGGIRKFIHEEYAGWALPKSRVFVYMADGCASDPYHYLPSSSLTAPNRVTVYIYRAHQTLWDRMLTDVGFKDPGSGPSQTTR